MELGKEKLNYAKTSIIGLGYFSINVALCLYGPFVPVLINKYTNSKFYIGLITTIGYLIAAVLQPTFGSFSDNTRTRFGKRKPFIWIGMPLAALAFVLMSYNNSFIGLIAFIMLFNVMLSIYRVPSMALMSDLTPPSLWNRANGIINFMGGIGALIAYFVGSSLFDKNQHYPFIMVAVLLIIVMFFITVLIKENTLDFVIKGKEEKVGVLRSFKKIMAEKDKSTLLLLFSVFFRFMGYNGLEAFITLYGIHYLKISTGSSAILLGIMALSFIIFAIPSGIIGTKIGKKKAVMLGLIIFCVAFFVDGIFSSFIVIAVVGPFVGFAYAMVNINVYPMLLDMGDKNENGTYTGLYYFFYSIASIVAPSLFGLIIDLIGYGVLFYVSGFNIILAIICFAFVKEKMRVEVNENFS